MFYVVHFSALLVSWCKRKLFLDSGAVGDLMFSWIIYGREVLHLFKDSDLDVSLVWRFLHSKSPHSAFLFVFWRPGFAEQFIAK